MAAKSPTTTKNKAAVLVSHRLQLAAVTGFILLVVSQLAMILPGLLSGPFSLFSWQALPMLGYSLTPVLFFVVFWLFSRSYLTAVNRIFIAVVKTMVVLAVFSILQAVRGWLLTWYFRAHKLGYAGPPAWISSTYVDFTLLALCLLGIIVVLWQDKRRKAY